MKANVVATLSWSQKTTSKDSIVIKTTTPEDDDQVFAFSETGIKL